MQLQIPQGDLHILCLGAHPDDVEIGCGGTLLTLQRLRPLTVTYVILSATSDREEEARSAARALFREPRIHIGGFRDGYLPEDWASVKQTLHGIARNSPAPDIIFAPRADDAHQDHRLLGGLVPTVWRSSLVLHYEIPKWDGDLGRPSLYVPLSPEIAKEKVDLLNLHYPSQHQRDWWDDEFFLGFMRIRGVEAKSRYAESFMVTKCVLGL